MRMYLSSFRDGNNPKELLRLLGTGRRTALIGNAMDMAEEAARKTSNDEESTRLSNLGLNPEEIDLRQYFGMTDALRKKLSDFDLIWARGGNTFILRRAFKQSGFDVILKDMLARDAIVYGGYSAGICLLATTLRGLELVDDPNTAPPGYEAQTIWDGIGLIPYSIAPHFKSNHPESEMIDRTVEYFTMHNLPYKTLRDGEVILVEGESTVTI